MVDLTKLPRPGADCFPAGVTDERGKNAFILRFGTAIAQAEKTNGLLHTTNGDETRYADKSGTYTKALKQISPGVVDPGTFAAFRKALGSSDGATPGTGDFEDAALKLGDERKLNGPQGAFAGTLAGSDSGSIWGHGGSAAAGSRQQGIRDRTRRTVLGFATA